MSTTDEPRRLLDDPETGEALRGVLEAGRDELPSEAQLASVAARLGPLLLPPSGGGGGADPSGGLAAGGSPAALAAKGMAALAAAAVAGAVVWGATQEAERAPPPEAAPRVEEAREEPVIASEELPEGVDPPVDDPAPAVRPRRIEEAAPALEIDPEAELALVREAQDALRSAPARALALAEEHVRRFGDGALAQEREVVAIDALSRLARHDEASARAARFHTRWPRSAHRRRIDVLAPPR